MATAINPRKKSPTSELKGGATSNRTYVVESSHKNEGLPLATADLLRPVVTSPGISLFPSLSP